MGEQEIRSVSARLPDNPEELACMNINLNQEKGFREFIKMITKGKLL